MKKVFIHLLILILLILPSNSTQCGKTTLTDFEKICLKSNPGAFFYLDGFCYIIAGESSSCTYGTELAVITSTDMAINMANAYCDHFSGGVRGYKSQQYHWRIGSPNQQKTNYYQIDKTSNGLYTMEVNVTDNTNTCPTLWLYQSSLKIVEYTDCSGSVLLCSMTPTFVQPECNQSLSFDSCSLNGTTTEASAIDCVTRCSMTTWCTGVNYKADAKICQQLIENKTSRSLQCNSGWTYYERIQ